MKIVNLYEKLDVHFAAVEAEILIALARYQYKNGDKADPTIVADVKQWLLNPAVRPLYDQQLLAEYPKIKTDGYTPEYLGIFFNIKNQAVMLRELRNAAKELKEANEILGGRISQLRSEEKLYRSPSHSHEIQNVNYHAFAKNFVNDEAQSIYFTLLHLLALNRRPVRHLLYTESKTFSYIRYYEYTLMKFKVEGRKKYLLARATPEELHAKGVENVEPTRDTDGPLFHSRLLIDQNHSVSPFFLTETEAFDHVIDEIQEIYDYAIESISTFNEAILNMKHAQMERLLSSKIVKDAQKSK